MPIGIDIGDVTVQIEERTGSAGADDTALIDLMKGVIPELMQCAHVPGVSIAVARRGALLWEAGFGFADLRTERRMTPDTVFRSGSMGKTYTATAAMQLVEAGRIALDGDVSDYVGFAVSNPLGQRAITVEDLLTHRSGLAPNAASSSFNSPPPLEEHLRADFAQGRRDLYRGALPKWTTPVGTNMQYSNTGMALLGLVVERTNRDGLTFGRYVNAHIIEPLGMTSSCHSDGNFDDPSQVPLRLQRKLGTGYAGWGQLNLPTPKVYFKDFPAGYLLTIPRDHIRLLLAYQAEGEYDDHRLLTSDTVRSMLTPRVGRPGLSTMVGLGWMLDNLGHDTEWFGHGGAHMWGWDSEFRAYPNLDLAVVVSTNRWSRISDALDAWHQRIPVMIEEIAADFLADRLRRRRLDTQGSWEWKCSYSIGLSFALDALYRLGIPERIHEGMVDEMIAGARGAGRAVVDPEGFKCGIADIAAAEPSMSGFQAFFASGSCRLSRAELNAAWICAGGMGAFPVPDLASERKDLIGIDDDQPLRH